VGSGEQVVAGGELDRASSGVLKSQVGCAVLGLVIEKPSHGYEIGQRFEDRFGPFLNAGRSSIYAALASLLDAGLIEKMSSRSSTGVRRGAKAGASYKATASGARAFRELLAERIRNDPQRVEMLGRMMAAGVHSIEAAWDFIDRYEQQCVNEAKQLTPRSTGEESAQDLASLMGRLLIDERRRMIGAQLDWLAYARAELRAARRAGPAGEGDDPG
jgi:DNA-binding PadR family transcriptional regulator